MNIFKICRQQKSNQGFFVAAYFLVKFHTNASYLKESFHYCGIVNVLKKCICRNKNNRREVSKCPVLICTLMDS